MLSFLTVQRNQLFLSLMLFTCLVSINEVGFALKGGNSASLNNYQGLVMLSYNGTASLKNCSGIVLESKRILTAASCVHHFNNIQASDIYVHRVVDERIGGAFILPILTPSSSDARVVSYTINPQNTFSSGPYNLAVLYLDQSINLAPATLYNGSNKFIGNAVTALGWKEDSGTVTQPFPQTFYYYLLNKLSFNIVDGNTNINGLCYDNFTYTGTVFCGGFRNSTNFLEYFQDTGAPLYKSVNGKQTVLGLLASASSGTAFEGQYRYEKYARISSMSSFIKQHAPSTQFWNETITTPTAQSSIAPILQLLLLED